jgi:hypothetical protein
MPFHLDAWTAVIGMALVAGIGLFLSGLLGEASKDTYAWIKRKLSSSRSSKIRQTFPEAAKIVYPPGAKHVERISVLDFYKQAHQSGFKLMGGARTALTIAQDIRQAALDGTLQTWGKTDSIGGPLVKIPPEHWKDFRLYWEQCFRFGPPDGQIEGFADDNSLVGTNGTRTTSNHRRGYMDVHLDLEQAKELLKT